MRWLYFPASTLARILNVVFTLAVVSRTTQTAFGNFAFLQASALTLATFLSFSGMSSLNVLLARDERPDPAAAAAVSLAYSLGVFLLAAVFFASAFAFGGGRAIAANFAALALLTGSSVATNLLSGVQFGVHRLNWVALANLFGAALSTILALSLPLATAGSILWVAIGASLLTSGLCLAPFLAALARLATWRDGLDFVRRNGVDFFSYGLKSMVTSTLVQVTLWFVQARIIAMAGPKENAHFAISSQFYNVAIFVPSILAPVMLRRLASEADRPRQSVQTALRLFGLCLALGALGVLASAALLPIVVRFLPAAYLQAQGPILLAVAAGALLLAKAPLSIFFQSRLQAAPEFVATSAAALVLLLSTLGGHYDATVANWARFGSHGVMLLIVASAMVLYDRPRIVQAEVMA